METIDTKIVYNIKKDSFVVTGNAKDPEKIVSNFLITQVSADKDESKPNDQEEYTIMINLDLSEDIFSVSHDCGNKGLREGILMRFLKYPCATNEQK